MTTSPSSDPQAVADPMCNDVRFNEAIVAVYRPHPVVDPWHCYNTRTGAFIEARTARQMARFGPYHQLPASTPASSDDEAAQVERMAKAMQAHLVAKYPLGQESWESTPGSAQDEYRGLARAALAALREGQKA